MKGSRSKTPTSIRQRQRRRGAYNSDDSESPKARKRVLEEPPPSSSSSAASTSSQEERPTIVPECWTESVRWLDYTSLLLCSFLGAKGAGRDAGWTALVVASFLTAFGGGAYCALIRWATDGEDLNFAFMNPNACLMWISGLVIYAFGMTPYEIEVLSGSVFFTFLTSWNLGILNSFSVEIFRRKGMYMLPIFVYLWCHGGGDTSTLLFDGLPTSISVARRKNEFILLNVVAMTNLIIARYQGDAHLAVVSSTLIYFSFAMGEKYDYSALLDIEKSDNIK